MVPSSVLCVLATLMFASSSAAFPSPLERARRPLERAHPISTDGSCGPPSGYTCQGSNFGNSCSKNNQCGRDNSYYELSQGCQPAYGYCAPKGSVSPDGSCGGSDGFICIGSNYGNSCGPNNKCGADAGYSGNGCQPQYGYCQRCTTSVLPKTITSTVSSTTTVPVTISTNTIQTLVSGISFITSTTTLLTTTTSTSTVTATATVTPVPITKTATTTITSTILNTLTVTGTSSAVFEKRSIVPEVIQTRPHGGPITARDDMMPRAASSGPGLSCGTVISTGFTTTTVTTTKVMTVSSTATAVSYTSTVVPSETSTVTTTRTSTVSTSVVITVTNTKTAVPLTTTTTVTTSTTVTVVAATATALGPGPIYQQEYKYDSTTPDSCTFDHYAHTDSQSQAVHVISTPNEQAYQAGVDDCAAQCTSATNCESFYFAYSNNSPICYTIQSLYQGPSTAHPSIDCTHYVVTTFFAAYYNKING